jgi:uncharacterized FlaG/YvyC family protein
MSENSIEPISSARVAAGSGTLPKPQVKARQVQVKAAAEQTSVQGNAPKQMENEPEQIGGSSNVSVHFRVNEDTNELTVFIVDRENKKVLRTIPASEFSKMNAGDILQMTA